MNIILSNPRDGKAYSKKTEEAVFVGKKIGETVELGVIGLDGYKAVITGGSDKDGFPMKPTLEGQARKKLLMEKGIGIRGKRRGEKRRKRVRGNTVAADIHQLNLKINEYGQKKLADVLKKAPSEEKEKKKTSKEKALEQKLSSAEQRKKLESKKGEQEESAGEKEEKPEERGKKKEVAMEEKKGRAEERKEEEKPTQEEKHEEGKEKKEKGEK